MGKLTPQYGQSSLDLTLQSYGGVDRFVKLGRDTGVLNLNVVENKSYIFDEQYIVDKNFIGYPYGSYGRYYPYDLHVIRFAEVCANAGRGLSDLTLMALDRFVLDLKGVRNPLYATVNIWGKIIVLYPVVGRSAFTHSLNLKNPLDLASAFRITYLGNPTHNINGINWLVGGVDGCNTNIAPSTVMTLNDSHIAYRGITTDSGGAKFPVTCFTSATSVITFDSSGNIDFYSNSSRIGVSNNTLDLYVMNRNSASNYNVYKNGVIAGTGGSPAGTLPSANLQFGGSPTFPSQRGLKFGSIGLSMTQAEQTCFYAAESNFQKTLGR